MTDEEIRDHLESLTGHVRALQAAVRQLVRLTVEDRNKENVREKAALSIMDDSLPLTNSDYPSRDEHELSLWSLQGLFADRALRQMPKGH